MEENTQKQTTGAQNDEKTPISHADDIKDNKLWAILSYLGVLALVPLLGKTDSPYVQFHAKQGLVILGGWVLSWLPFGFVFAIAAIIFSVMGVVNVLKNEKKKLPIVGDLAEKINF